ncbi:MAG: phosphomannomutase/phosphoglucomutase [Nanoarchaeota archaeon]|nr:phosphomannomutase/phosphoglucomutase [Nanoarchaeota archaeon]
MKPFHAYDIRGPYPDDVNETFAENLGRAFARWLGNKYPNKKLSVAVGSDVRLSSPSLKKALVAGLTQAGCDVIDVGVVPTPVVYFASVTKKTDGAIVVTASHNPGNDNGFKLCARDAQCISYEAGMHEIESLMDEPLVSVEPGTVTNVDIVPAYIADMLSKTTVPKLRIVVDAANGAMSDIAPRALEQAGLDVVPLYCVPDGTFPNHEADPLKLENMRDLMAAVTEYQADLGIGLDGDGDRLNFVDKHGKIVDSDLIISLLARTVLKQQPGAMILSNVLASQTVTDTIKQHGGTTKTCRVGHTYIMDLMREVGAAFCGEPGSGHYFFADNYNYDDALYATLKVLEAIGTTPLHEAVADIPRYKTSPEYRPTVSHEQKTRIVNDIAEELRKTYDVNTLDGVRVQLDDGWFIIRPSNTQPRISIRFEGKTDEAYARIHDLVETLLAKHNVTLECT